jgi:hypothetical protein
MRSVRVRLILAATLTMRFTIRRLPRKLSSPEG